ncbi:MAG: hypothetical protein ACLQPD_13245 [Desulfomonilaceae bacterium]
MKVATAPTSQDLWNSQLSPGEAHFLYWFMQGGIMDPYVWQNMRKAWGMCERHAWGWFRVETAFRHSHMHGPAILYKDLIERAVRFCSVRGPMSRTRARISLREKGRCLMCEAEFGPHSKTFAEPKLIQKARDLGQLRSIGRRTFPYWSAAVCGTCAGTSSTVRCRRHFLEERNPVWEFDWHKEFLTRICHLLATYAQSFRWGFHHLRTDEGVAALISAIGWCSGWTILLSLMDESESSELRLIDGRQLG